MMNPFCHEVSNKVRSCLLACAILLTGTYVQAQQSTTVLPNNATYSNKNIPQGALRYQRGFYLVTPAEMSNSGLTSGMNINAIGFTIGRAQNDTTKGRFRVFLENTNDVVSRADTGWNTVTTTTNEYNALNLFPGNYEWQVQANCSGNSAFTPVVFFANDNLLGCNNPYNLATISITTNTATLKWEAATSPSFVQYLVEYSPLDVVNWVAATTTDTFYNVSGLNANKTYQWRVKTVCSAASSAVNYSTFTTNAATGCTPITGLSATVTNDSLVALSWTSGLSASFYEIQFRRTGTSEWSNAISFTNSANFVLPAGTSYQWQVRMDCGSGVKGVYTSSTFTTGGASVCYPPNTPTTRNITGSSAKLTWTAVVGATGYTVRYRLKNSISWTSATQSPMLLTCDSLISIPDTTGNYDIPFHGGGSFTYTGGGVYVAWEYSRPLGNLSTSNLSLSTTRGTSLLGSNGQDSITYLLCMVSQADTALTGLPEILGETRQRPETRFGSGGLKDSVAVVAVYALGMTVPRFQSPTPISAVIANLSATSKTYNVTLTVREKQSGAVRYTTTTPNVAVTATDSVLVNFNGWSPTVAETDSITVSILPEPNENVVNNNSKSYQQVVNGSSIAYDDGSGIVSSAGLGNAAGLLLSKHKIEGCGRVIAAKVYLTGSAENKPLRAVIRNTAGAVVAQSPVFTPTSSDVNNYHSFYFSNPAAFSNQDFYIGIAQEVSTSAYYPVGSQWEDAETRKGAYYRSNLDGTGLVDSPQLGRLMIRAEVVSSSPDPVIKGNLTLCTGSTTTLTAGSEDKQYASSVIAFSSQNADLNYSAAQALGSPNVFPAYALSPDAWIGNSADGQREYLVLGFANAMAIDFIDLFETANPGAIDTVYVKNPGTSAYDVVYTGTAAAAGTVARKNRISFPLTAYNVSEIRIALNSSAVPGYNAIDAVAIGKSTTPGVFASYLWTPGGETTNTKLVNAPGVYKLTVTNGSGCQSSDSVTVTAALTTPPVITPGGPLTICQDDSIKLTSSQPNNNLWSTGATTSSIYVKTAGLYFVSYDNGSGCGSLTSTTVAVSVDALPVVTITGALGICPGASTTLDAGAGYASYLWSTGATTQTIAVTSQATFSVTVTNANGCKGSAFVHTNFSAPPTPVITGTLEFCPGNSTTLDAGAGYTSYLWSNGATSQTINVTTAATYSVTVTNADGCTGTDSKTVTAVPAPTPVISGTLSFCGGSFTTLDAGAGYSSYSWSTGATTRTILVFTAGTFSVTVTNSFGCSGSSSVTTSLAGSLPVPPGAITGPTVANCNSSGHIYTIAPVTNASHYVWTLPPGGFIVNGQGTTSISVDFAPSFKGGYIVVAASNACGQSPSITPRRLFVQALAGVPGAISGQTTSLCGPITRTYTIAPVTMATSYMWSLPPGASIVSGQGTTSLTVLFAAGFGYGNLCVTANNSCGASAASCVQVTGQSPMPGTITGLDQVCKNASSIAYSIAPVPGATSYTWTVPQAAQVNAGQGTNNITVNFGPHSGNVTVKAVSACGISLAQVKAVTVILCTTGPEGLPYSIAQLRPVPEVVSAYGGFTNTGKLNIDWTLGEPRIETETGGDILYTQGFHQPMVYFMPAKDPVKPSDSTILVAADGMKITVYPNPVRSVLKVKIDAEKGDPHSLELMDIFGRVLQRRNIPSNRMVIEIPMAGYIGGSYMLIVRDTKGAVITTVKLVKVD